MREKLFTWSGKPLVVALLLWIGLCFSNGLQAQSSKFTIGTWYDQPTAVTRLSQQVQFLDNTLQSPPASPSPNFLKHQHWYFREILAAIQGGETVPRSVESGQEKIWNSVRPDRLNPDLTQKEVFDLLQSGYTLLTY